MKERVLLGIFIAVSALARDPLPDVYGKDHPLVPPYAGSTRIESVHGNFERMRFPVGRARHFFGAVKEYVRVEGAMTRFVYDGPQERTPLEIFLSYRDALAEKGFREVKQGESGGSFPATRFLSALGLEGQERCHDYDVEKSNYLLTRGTVGAQTVHVAVFTARCTGNRPVPGFKGTRTVLWIVESKTTEKGKVKVDAAAMLQDLRAKGFTVPDGILFDFDGARLRAESDPVLKEIAALLKREPSLRLYVVGHTEMQGTLDDTVKRSRERATAVVAWLEKTGGIARGRVVAHGVGPLAPRASNREEAGRESNRRVELVEIVDKP